MADSSDDLSFKDFFGISKDTGDGNAQDAVINHIFVACAGENNPIVHADQLISFITPFLKDNTTAVEKLRKTLDPNNLNQEIDLNQFHNLMETWISVIPVEDDLHNITPRDSHLLADLSYTQSTPKSNFGHHQLKECIESGIINVSISPSSYSLNEFSSTNKGPEKTILEEQIQELEFQKKRMSEEIDRMKIELANSLETNENIQVRLEQALIKVSEKQKLVEKLQELTQSKDDDNEVELEKMRKFSAGLETKVLSLEIKISDLSEELVQLQTENEKLEKGNQKLWKEKDAFFEEMIGLQKEIDVLKQDNALQQQFYDALNEKKRNLEDNNEEYACTIEKLKLEKAALENLVKPIRRQSLESNSKSGTTFIRSNSISEYSPIAQQILKKHAYNTPTTMFKLKNPISPLLSNEKIKKFSPNSYSTSTPQEGSIKSLMDSEVPTLNNSHTVLIPSKSEDFEFNSPPVMYVVERSVHKYNNKKNRSCDDLLGMVVVSNLNENIHEEIDKATSEKKMLSFTSDNSIDENLFEEVEKYPSLQSEINDLNSVFNVQDFSEENNMLRKQVEQLKEKLNEFQNEIDKCKNENEALKIFYDNEITNLSKEKESILDRLKCIERGEIEMVLEETSSNFTSNMRESKKKLNTKRSNYDKLVFKNSKLEQKTFDLEEKLLVEKNHLAEAVSRNKLIEDKLKKLKEENCELEERLMSGYDQVLFKNGELEQKTFDLEHKLLVEKNLLAEAISQNKLIEDKLRKVNEENLRVEEQLRLDYDQLLFNNDELEQKVLDLEDKLLEEKNLLTETVTEKKLIEDKLSKVNEENLRVEEQLRLDYDQLLFNNGELEQKVLDLEDKLVEEKNLLTETVTEKELIEDKLSKINEENLRVDVELRSNFDKLLFKNAELEQKAFDLEDKLLVEKNLLGEAVTQKNLIEDKLQKVNEDYLQLEEELKSIKIENKNNNFESIKLELEKYTENLFQKRSNLENNTLTLTKYFSIPKDLIRKILKTEACCLNASESFLNLEQQILNVIEQMEISSNVLNFLNSQKSKITFKSESCQTEMNLETESIKEQPQMKSFVLKPASFLPKLLDQNLGLASSNLAQENKDIGLQIDSKCLCLEESSVMETHISPRPRSRVIRMVTNFLIGWMIFMGIFCLIIIFLIVDGGSYLLPCGYNCIDNPWIPFVEKRYIRPPPI